MSTIVTRGADWIGTKAKFSSLSNIEQNRKYYISDLETFAITNSAMAEAKSIYSNLYPIGEVYVCSDNGTYAQGRLYKWTGTDWEDITSTPTSLNLDNVLDGATRKLSDYATLTGTETLSNKTFQGNIRIIGSGGAVSIYTSALRDLYHSGTRHYFIHPISGGGVEMDVSEKTFHPTASNSDYTLGTSDFQWKDLYLHGNLSNGTDSISIADIATKDSVPKNITNLTNDNHTLKRIVVSSLPTSNIDPDAIYMILKVDDDPSIVSEQGNMYNEYMYINNDWERIGGKAKKAVIRRWS